MLKVNEREVVLATLDWDDAVATDIRNKWVKNFLMMGAAQRIEVY